MFYVKFFQLEENVLFFLGCGTNYSSFSKCFKNFNLVSYKRQFSKENPINNVRNVTVIHSKEIFDSLCTFIFSRLK